ncbi:hypothetical protein [Metabacillus sediminilitoris]|uniref:hypothetical protein n=1 Tax=Metabacillus sediminilitoris TaxID=2567941 RepID=UPI001454CE82|nr:hypothetical protein [Metabacillus sediminilitoris]
MEKDMNLASFYVYYALSFTIKEFLTEHGDDFKAIVFRQLLFSAYYQDMTYLGRKIHQL